MTPHHVSKKRTLPLLIGLFFAVSALAGCLGGDDVDSHDHDGGDHGDDGDHGDAGMGSDGADIGDTGADDGMGDTGSGDDMDDNGPTEAAPCIPSLQNLATLGFDGPAVPDPTTIDEDDPASFLSATSDSTFNVPEGTTLLVLTVSHGAYLTLGWDVVLIDPSGNEATSMSGSAGGDPTGGLDGETKDINAPLDGIWTVSLGITGYIEDFTVTVDGEVCA